MRDPILIVEPDRAVREVLDEALQNGGFDRLSCSSVADALATLHGQMSIACLVIDLWLYHDSNDPTALVALLDIAAARGVPVIALSTDARPLQLTLTDGSVFVCQPLTMPFKIEDLVQAVSQQVTHSASQRYLAPSQGSLECASTLLGEH